MREVFSGDLTSMSGICFSNLGGRYTNVHFSSFSLFCMFKIFLNKYFN